MGELKAGRRPLVPSSSDPITVSAPVIVGECVAEMKALPEASVDMVFADPPYNLQLPGALSRPDSSRVDAVDEDWDKFGSFAEYDAFTREWLAAARRAMKPNATIFVVGSYHNIFRVGSALQDMGFWILNDVVWLKANPMPNFRGRRFTNAHETLIWASRDSKSRYTFNYDALKAGNDDVQARSDWYMPTCGGGERLRDAEGRKVHPTQKPEALVARAVQAASRPGDVIMDPFAGTGTTGAVAKRLRRRFVGFERDAAYARAANDRIASIVPFAEELVAPVASRREEPRIPFAALVERGLIAPGAVLHDLKGRWSATVRADGTISSNGVVGSIHSVGARLQSLPSCNGWSFWHHNVAGTPTPIDDARAMARREAASANGRV